MPIYAPTLPPAPDLHQGQPPALVLMRFDLTRLWRQKIGRFFGFAFLLILIWKVARIYVDHLLQTNQAFKPMQDFARTILTQGADFQADLLNPASYLLWFLVALVSGGLVARDTLYRVRPLMYAHPVAPKDYLLAKLGFASLLPFIILLPFALLPWLMSLLLAGLHGPVWATAPLRLLPAMAVSSVLMGSLAVGAGVALAMLARPEAQILRYRARKEMGRLHHHAHTASQIAWTAFVGASALVLAAWIAPQLWQKEQGKHPAPAAAQTPSHRDAESIAPSMKTPLAALFEKTI